jgi:hypothetical protein
MAISIHFIGLVIVRVWDYTEVRKAREAAEAAEEERKRQQRELEVMEENLILKGHV